MNCKIIGFHRRLMGGGDSGNFFGDLAKQYHLSFLKNHSLTWQLLILVFYLAFMLTGLCQKLEKVERSILKSKHGADQEFCLQCS